MTPLCVQNSSMGHDSDDDPIRPSSASHEHKRSTKAAALERKRALDEEWRKRNREEDEELVRDADSVKLLNGVVVHVDTRVLKPGSNSFCLIVLSSGWSRL